MTKHSKKHEGQATDGEPLMGQAHSDAAPASREIAVNGLAIEVPSPYSEGHVLNAAEAHTLNQTFAENVSNNFRTSIKKALEAHNVTKVEELSAEVISKLKADGSAYASTYQFSISGRGPRAIVDPVEREMHKIAGDLVRTALRAKKVDLKKLEETSPGKLEELISSAMASKPAIREEAERRVKARAELADLSL